jgi:hypothetical protein
MSAQRDQATTNAPDIAHSLSGLRRGEPRYKPEPHLVAVGPDEFEVERLCSGLLHLNGENYLLKLIWNELVGLVPARLQLCENL